jgi:hypothetical protein
MKKKLLTFVLALFAVNVLTAQITVSGILDSSVSLQAGAADAPKFSFGFEEYANLRFQSRVRDRAVVYGAVNFIAASGDYAANAEQAANLIDPNGDLGISPTAFVTGENFIAAIELERLYFRLNGEFLDFDGGLMRLPFGYGQVWGSSDFLNPKNPLRPDARPRAVLGAGLSWYPADELKLLAFSVSGRNPFSRNNGVLAGLSMDRHWDRASVQALYSFESPSENFKNGIHRFGTSLKLDVMVGLVVDALYTYNYEAGTKLDGLSLSLGADYSFFDGNLIVLAEYLYNGETSSTALGYGGSFSNNHYLYTGLTWRFNDFTNMSAALISGFDDISFTPVISLNHDLFQGATLTITAQVPMDRDLFYSDGNRGELGPLPPGSNIGRYFNCTVRLRLRF